VVVILWSLRITSTSTSLPLSTLSSAKVSRLRPKHLREGFSKVFPIKDLAKFTVDELVMLFGNSDEDWSEESKWMYFLSVSLGLTPCVSALGEALKADHGFTADSKAIQNLIEIMAEYDSVTRRSYLQFITGSPKLPIGGMSHADQIKTYVNALCRFPRSQSTAYRCPKAPRITFDGRRLPSKRHDLRQLLEASRLLLQGGYEAEAASSYVGRNGKFPPFVASTDLLFSPTIILRTSISNLPYICTHPPHCSPDPVKRYSPIHRN
jgi:hypothetical protein